MNKLREIWIRFCQWACPHGYFKLDEIGDVYCADCGKDFTD